MIVEPTPDRKTDGMIFNGVPLPDEIRIALEEGRLVVFAGAGVSQGKPSCLPDFPGLVARIGADFGLKVGNVKKKEHQILGKWRKDGHDVHTAAARILYNNQTKPTDLHREILKVFGAVPKIRVVTTNFDNHFSDAAKEVFPAHQVTEYHAPALPLGDDFEGIVYLHGAAKLDPKKMVLTDEDFGRAYLTRGWARDFLTALFSKYTVLFVGYSHNDVTVSYLSRGMNPGDIQTRQALVPSDSTPEDRENWDLLEIKRIEYPVDLTMEGDAHQALTDFFRSWVQHVRESIFDRSVKVKAIAAGLPPEKDEESEYLAHCLTHPQLTQDFCDAIQHPAWMGWMRKRRYFSAFFATDQSKRIADLLPHEHVIARWLCTFARTKHPELLLELIEQNHGILSHRFAYILAQPLLGKKGRASDPRFATWLSILLAQGKGALPENLWAYLLQECKFPEHAGVALRLFEMLTTPNIHLQRYWDFGLTAKKDGEEAESNASDRKVDYEVSWPGETEYWLDEAWKNVFRPHLSSLAEQVVVIVTRQLTSGHLLFRGVGKAGESYDPLSWTRSSIAPHEQDSDRLHKCLSFLVDVARELLDHWLSKCRPRALAQMEAWWASGVPLLRRLTIYGIANDSGRSADEKLHWLLENDLIFALGMKKEVFDVLASGYPGASSKTRRQVIGRIKKGIKGEMAEKLEAETIAYESFNALQWLKKVAPDCRQVASALRTIRRAYPHFGVRDHPEFDHWSGEGGVIDPKKGFDFEQILAAPPDRYLNDLLTAKEASPPRGIWDYLSHLKVLFEKDRGWGHRFMSATVRRRASESELWVGVFSAWQEIIKTQTDWLWILDRAEELPSEPAVFTGVVYLFSHGFWSNTAKVPQPVIARAARLMARAWDLFKDDSEQPDQTYRDWYTNAINHRGGWIARFWIMYCNHLRKRAKGNWRGIPKALKRSIIEALEGLNKVRTYARIVLIPDIAYFFVWDRKLVSEKFVPLFDWKHDPVVAQQTWSVFLNYRHATNPESEKDLIPYYRQFVAELGVMLKQAAEQKDQFDPHTLQQLGWHLASLAMSVIPNPVESGFFGDFLPLLPAQVRGSLARGMGHFIKEMKPDKLKTIWQTWLMVYLDNRILGIPASLSHEETKSIVDWCLSFGDLFPEVVAKVAVMPLKGVFAFSVTDKMLKSPLLEQYPDDACRFCVLVLRAEDFPLLHDHLLELHTKFSRTIFGKQSFKDFEEQMFLRGWRKDKT